MLKFFVLNGKTEKQCFSGAVVLSDMEMLLNLRVGKKTLRN